MRVLFLASGVYPHYAGGVSTWADQLVHNLQEFQFFIVSVVSNPHVELRYTLPQNVKDVYTIPMWGSDRPEEYGAKGLSRIMKNRLNTSNLAVEQEFIPYYEMFLQQCLDGGESPEELGKAIHHMYRFFLNHDFRHTLRCRAVWQTFRRIIGSDKILEKMDLYQAVSACRTLDRYLRVLTLVPPKTELSHCSMAGMAGVIGIIAKLEYNTPLILTEHGVYLRERLLDLVNLPLDADLPSKVFWSNFFRAIVKLNYHYAEAIFPVCDFNSRWERELIGKAKELRVVHNGVDADRFHPSDRRPAGPPTVLALIRIDRFKDPLNLIKAMKYVREEIPDVRCLIYGPTPDEEYAKLVEDLVKREGLEKTVSLEGYTRQPDKDYLKGDVAVMCSLSEGFPFALIEGMACGKAFVATDVGGMHEALGDAGILVPPRSPSALAQGIITLLKDSSLRRDMEDRSRGRILELFTIRKAIDQYRSIYQQYGRAA